MVVEGLRILAQALWEGLTGRPGSGRLKLLGKVRMGAQCRGMRDRRPAS